MEAITSKKPEESLSRQANRYYLSVFFKYFWVYGLGIFAVSVTNFSETMIPRLVQWAIDLVIHDPKHTVPLFFKEATDAATLTNIASSFFVFMALGWIGRVCWRQCLARRTHYSGKMLRNKLWNIFRFMPLRTFQEYSLGDLLNRSISDVNSSRFILGFTLVLSADIVFFTTLALIMMFSIDWQLTLYCILVFPFIPYFIIPLTKKEYAQHTWAQEKLSGLSELITQALVTIRLQRSTAIEDVWKKKLYSEAEEYTRRRFEVVKTAWKVFPYGAAPTLIAYAVLLILGVKKIQAGELSIGGFVALLSYVQMLEGPLFELGDAIAEWQKGLSSLSRVVELFGINQDDRHRKSKTEVDTTNKIAISANAINFNFDVGSRKILNDVNFQIPKGEWTGITGVIGTGKSTLLSLLAGVETDYQGKLELFGQNLDHLSRKQITDLISFIPQRPFLFGGTVRHNLNLDKKFSTEELWEVLELVRLADDFRDHKLGLDTWIGEWGINLSGGQKQRLTLARALLRPKPILMIDDCLSAVDALTEEAILGDLKSAIGDLTLVWVAHRVSTLKLCDKIYLMESGSFTSLDHKVGGGK